MGEFANTGGDAEANTGIGTTLGWTVSNGMIYYDTTNHQFRIRINAAWQTMSAGVPTLASVLGAGNDTGGNDIDVGLPGRFADGYRNLHTHSFGHYSSSSTMLITPVGHSRAQMPQPLQWYISASKTPSSFW